MLSNSEFLKGVLTVIIPVYNVEEYVEECLNSVIGQTYKNLQILLVDDGSTDSSGEICEQFALKDKRIQVLHKENGGLADARNYAFPYIKGEYVAFVDSDDYIAIDMYEKLISLIEEYHADVAMAKLCSVEDELGQGSRKVEVLNRDELLIAYANVEAENHISPAVWLRVYRSEKIEDIRFPKGKLYEDIMFSSQYFDKIKIAIKLNQCLYFYRRRENSITVGSMERVLKGQATDEVEQFFLRILFFSNKNEKLVAGWCSYSFYIRLLEIAISFEKNKGCYTEEDKKNIYRYLYQFRWKFFKFIKKNNKLTIGNIVSVVSPKIFVRLLSKKKT